MEIIGQCMNNRFIKKNLQKFYIPLFFKAIFKMADIFWNFWKLNRLLFSEYGTEKNKTLHTYSGLSALYFKLLKILIF